MRRRVDLVRRLLHTAKKQDAWVELYYCISYVNAALNSIMHTVTLIIRCQSRGYLSVNQLEHHFLSMSGKVVAGAWFKMRRLKFECRGNVWRNVNLAAATISKLTFSKIQMYDPAEHSHSISKPISIRNSDKPLEKWEGRPGQTRLWFSGCWMNYTWTTVVYQQFGHNSRVFYHQSVGESEKIFHIFWRTGVKNSRVKDK